VDVDEVILERLEFLRNEVVYLKQERDRLRSFQEYANGVRLRRAVEAGTSGKETRSEGDG